MKRSLAPFILVLLASGVAAFAPEEWSQAKGDHFIVFAEDGNTIQAGRLLHQAERFFEQISETLGYFDRNAWRWENRCRIYLYRDANSYQRDSGQPAWSGAAAIHYPSRKILANGGSETLLEGDLPHEITHLVFRAYMGLRNTHVPSWLDEGLAAWHEEGKRVEAYQRNLKETSPILLIPLATLNRVTEKTFHSKLLAKKNAVSLYYTQSYGVVDFLIRGYGKPRFADFLRMIKNGSDLDTALAKAYGHEFNNLSSLEKKWRESLR